MQFITEIFSCTCLQECLKSDWMKKYIDFDTEKKKNAANSFEKRIIS